MDVSVKQLSEILKIDPDALLKKMIEAGLPHTSIEDSVSNEDKQTLLTFIRTAKSNICLLYTSPSPRDLSTSRMPSSA